ncbi:hypothetical protein I3760_14G110000 [Carya illinoinensis]|uniref:Uncharacterized protein n=1 Tax=Carya illinoinensis TaxID=32201 RepID=A0A8T1NLK6_CARIL|nr:hypothetical protein I3760_14G110000 [Carya illinoinensis]KAG6629767.1 hypothetical protein CIPAW_14G108100 [Carya illinoinensis]
MRFLIDLRFLFVPPIGLALRFIISQDSSWPQNGNFKLESLGLPMFLLTFLVVVGVTFLCLVISIKFVLTVERLRLQTGDVSCPLTILLIASLILPLSVFWFAYLMLLLLSPCSGFIFYQLKRFVYRFCHPFRATFFCYQEEAEPPLPQVGVQVIEVEGSNND